MIILACFDGWDVHKNNFLHNVFAFWRMFDSYGVQRIIGKKRKDRTGRTLQRKKLLSASAEKKTGRESCNLITGIVRTG